VTSKHEESFVGTFERGSMRSFGRRPHSTIFVPGKMLAQDGEDVDDLDAMYLVTMRLLQAWHYDERARLIGENFLEYRSRRVVTKPDPVDVITPAEARRLYAPILANPPFPIPSS
jgi:hypothetical protein